MKITNFTPATKTFSNKHHHSYFSLPILLFAITSSIIIILTTIVQQLASSTVATRPSSGRAPLIPGQPLYLQCEMIGNKNAEFKWYKRAPFSELNEVELQPAADDNIEIHNEKLTIHRPSDIAQGDYICRALHDDKSPIKGEEATIKVRPPPYILDFGLDTSHTGKSSTIIDGERLELNCTVSSDGPVNITWLRSATSDDERTMVPLPETDKRPGYSTSSPSPDLYAQTFTVPDQDIIVESLGPHSKRLIIESVRPEHRSYYVCIADNGVTDRTQKKIFIRVKDKLVALWPFLGIVAELFILFTIIHIWETQRAYKEIHSTPPSAPSTGGVGKRPATGASVPFEIEPLTNG